MAVAILERWLLWRGLNNLKVNVWTVVADKIKWPLLRGDHHGEVAVLKR